jgi:hypothetical protein
VWLAFVLMLTIFHHPKANIFLASFLQRKKKMLATSQAYFFPFMQFMWRMQLQIEYTPAVLRPHVYATAEHAEFHA